MTVDLGNRLHHAGRSGHVDLPHLIEIEYAITNRIDDKSQVNHSAGFGLLEQLYQAVARILAAQIHALELRKLTRRRRFHIHANDMEVLQKRK